MNYAVYSYQVVNGQTICRIVAYQMSDTNGVKGFSMMDKAQATVLANTMSTPDLTVMVLPLETDRAITAF